MRLRHSASSGRGPRAVCALALALAAGAVTGRAADEQAPARPSSAATEDSITSAKRDFEALKAARNPALQQKADVPRLAIPEAPGRTPSAGPVAPKTPGTEKKSANWLLEAMEKQTPRSERDRARRDLKSERAATDDVGDDRGEERLEDARREESPQEIEKQKREAEALNPLNRFLGEWMTPQDYALLKTGFDESFSKTGLPAGASSAAAPGLPSTGVASADIKSLGTDANVRGAVAAAPRENPYLSLLNSPVAPAPSAPVFTAPPAPIASAPPPLISAPVPAEPAKAKIPEFAKPAQDEKYFRQLKRF